MIKWRVIRIEIMHDEKAWKKWRCAERNKGDIMYKIYNLKSNENVEVSAQAGPFTVLEFQDGAKPQISQGNSAMMNLLIENMFHNEKRQLIAQMVDNEMIIGEDRLSWMVGECAINPEESSRFNLQILGKNENSSSGLLRIKGNGTIALQAIDDYLMLVNMRDWPEGVVCELGMFEACEGNIKVASELATHIPSMQNPQKSLRFISLAGNGVMAMRLPCLSSALVLVEVEKDELRIEGEHAIAWSKTLEFSIREEQADLPENAKRIQTFKGTGKILLSPVRTFGTKVD